MTISEGDDSVGHCLLGGRYQVPEYSGTDEEASLKFKARKGHFEHGTVQEDGMESSRS